MGQRTSRSSSTTGGGQAQPTFLLMEFARLWLGGDLPELSVARLPSSWDELLDWSEDAEKMSVVISSSSASHSRQNMHRVLQIVPLVDSRERHRVESLASIPPIEQADFFADAVVIKFEMEKEQSITLTAPDRLLTVKDFAEYYKLVRRLSDLLVLKRSERVSGGSSACPSRSSKLRDCVICFDETSSSILPCDHRVCESCERRWVRKRLQCPFCRTSFKSVKHIRSGGWCLSEFSPPELCEDIDELYSRLEEFWGSCGYATTLKERTVSFEPVGRHITVTKDDVGLVVSRT